MEPFAPANQDRGKPCAFKLHLELINGGLDDDDLTILRRYGKMQTAISRDIIIPATMTFHALHYAIQKFFGWQNSHLHHYSIPEIDFEEITQNKFYDWGRLCGILFRYPSDNDADLYSYDYGDNWKVKITCSGVYYDRDDFAQKERGADAGQLLQLMKEEIPVCVATDGLGVLDDVGGMSGFCRFLRDMGNRPLCLPVVSTHSKFTLCQISESTGRKCVNN